MTPEAQRLAIRGNGGQGTNGVKVSKPTCRTNPCGPLVRMLPDPCHTSPDTARERCNGSEAYFNQAGWWWQAQFWATTQAYPDTGVRGPCQAKRRCIRGDRSTVRSAGIRAQRLAPFGCRQGQAKRVRSAGIPAQRLAPFGCRQGQAKRVRSAGIPARISIRCQQGLAKRRYITGHRSTVRSPGIPAQRVAPFGCRQGLAKRIFVRGSGPMPRAGVSSAANPRWSHDAYA